MLSSHQREVSVAFAIAALALVLAVTAPGYFSPANLGRPVPRQPAGAHRRARRDAGHPDRRDRHLGRFAVRDLRRGRGRWRQGGPADRRGARSRRAPPARCSARSTARWSPISVFPRSSSRWRRWWRSRDALRWIDAGRVGAGLAGELSVAGAVAAAYPLVAFGDCRCAAVRRSPGWHGTCAAGRAVYATGSNPDAARLAGIDTARVKFVVFMTAGALTGAGRAAQRGALQPDSQQRRPRPRDEGHRRGRRRRHRHSRRPRHLRRHAARRDPARRDRSGADVPRRERLLGARHPGRDHPGRGRGRRVARAPVTLHASVAAVGARG